MQWHTCRRSPFGPTRSTQGLRTHVHGLLDKRTHMQQPICRSAAGPVNRAAITHAGASELVCRARQSAFAPRTWREALHTTARPPARAMAISAAGGPPSRSRPCPNCLLPKWTADLADSIAAWSGAIRKPECERRGVSTSSARSSSDTDAPARACPKGLFRPAFYGALHRQLSRRSPDAARSVKGFPCINDLVFVTSCRVTVAL